MKNSFFVHCLSFPKLNKEFDNISENVHIETTKIKISASFQYFYVRILENNPTLSLWHSTC